MRLVDLGDPRSKCARLDRQARAILKRLDGGVGDRLAETEVVDDDLHGPTLSSLTVQDGACSTAS
jgi:hypothetical protein